jgi:hypothetical protein
VGWTSSEDFILEMKNTFENKFHLSWRASTSLLAGSNLFYRHGTYNRANSPIPLVARSLPATLRQAAAFDHHEPGSLPGRRDGAEVGF